MRVFSSLRQRRNKSLIGKKDSRFARLISQSCKGRNANLKDITDSSVTGKINRHFCDARNQPDFAEFKLVKITIRHRRSNLDAEIFKNVVEKKMKKVYE